MSDVLFRYLLAARAHDGAWHQRAFLADERQLAASVERVIETAALRVELVSQHRRVARASVVAPASKAEAVDFVWQVRPEAPQLNHFENRQERFPLASSLNVTTCEPCTGSGIIDCRCAGSGREPCGRCNGTGRGYGSVNCAECGGDGHQLCMRCRGRGFFKHEDCNGEGKIGSWEEEVHTYSVKQVRDALLPPDAPLRSMAAAADRWLADHDEVLTEISDDAVSSALGYATPELTLMLNAARRVQAAFEAKARSDPEQFLFSAVRLQVVPVSACLVRSERSESSSRFWLVGRGESAVEIRPPVRIDAWKSLGWPGLVLGGGAAVGLALQLGMPALLGPEWLSAEAVAGMTALATIGLPTAGVGVKRFWRGLGDRVRTIAVIPCSGRPTIYLPCLTTLGGYLQRLEMRDRSYKASIDAMMGSPRPPHQSQTVVVKTARNELVRMIEIPRADQLSRQELARMMGAVNGVLFLEDPEHPADALRKEMHIATDVRPPEVRLLVEADQAQSDPHGLAPGGGVALEAVRRSWTRERSDPVEFAAVFERLWSPVAMVLSGLRVPVIRRLRKPLRLVAGRG